MSPKATTFISPALPMGPKSSSASRGARKSSRRVKATASPPPPPPSGKGKGGSPGGSDSAGDKMAALERAFAKNMTPAEGRTGERECIWCGGAKQRRCSWCEGTGVRHETVDKSWDELAGDIEKMKQGAPMELPKRLPVTCSACSGSCKLRCAFCRGSGVGSYGHSY